MAWRYVPPALRRQQAKDSVPSRAEADPSTQTALLPRKLEDLKPSEPDRGHLFRLDEIHVHFLGPEFSLSSRSTLNDSLDLLDQLAYVTIFKDSNPRWGSDQILFAHTSIAFLPGYDKAFPAMEDGELPRTSDEQPPGTQSETASGDVLRSPVLPNQQLGDGAKEASQPAASNGPDSKAMKFSDVRLAQSDTPSSPTNPLSTTPIAVFEQHSSARSKELSIFRFTGWFQLERVEFLKPRSEALTRMLIQKWTKLDKFGLPMEVKRDGMAWKSSMSLRWAVIKLAKTAEQPASPAIERFEHRPEPHDEGSGRDHGISSPREEPSSNEANHSQSNEVKPVKVLYSTETMLN